MLAQYICPLHPSQAFLDVAERPPAAQNCSLQAEGLAQDRGDFLELCFVGSLCSYTMHSTPYPTYYIPYTDSIYTTYDITPYTIYRILYTIYHIPYTIMYTTFHINGFCGLLGPSPWEPRRCGAGRRRWAHSCARTGSPGGRAPDRLWREAMEAPLNC